MSNSTRPVPVGVLNAGLRNPFWDTTEARAVLGLFGDEALTAVFVALCARTSELHAASDTDMIDLNGPPPDPLLLPITALRDVLEVPFLRAASAALHPED